MVFTLTLRPLLTSSFAAAVLTAAIRHRRAANVNTGRDKLLSFPPHTFCFSDEDRLGLSFYFSEILY